MAVGSVAVGVAVGVTVGVTVGMTIGELVSVGIGGEKGLLQLNGGGGRVFGGFAVIEMGGKSARGAAAARSLYEAWVDGFPVGRRLESQVILLVRDAQDDAARPRPIGQRIGC